MLIFANLFLNHSTTFMEKKRILYISQEIVPYLPESAISETSRFLPQKMNDKGQEVRIFMPRFGCINERRHQLHEVIRLSGMNLIINDMDQPLIIKVASVPQARMQVYFIDNEEYFKRKTTLTDKEGRLHPDNDERSIFFGRGVLETVKKLGWAPDIIHCHGWMSSLVPLYLRSIYADDPIFENAKVVYSAYNDSFEGSLSSDLKAKLTFDGIDKKMIDNLEDPSHDQLMMSAIEHSDAVIAASDELSDTVVEAMKETESETFEVLGATKDTYFELYNEIYNQIVTEESVV